MYDLFETLKATLHPSGGKAAGPPEYLVAGLGNPDQKYQFTRHNAGFMAIDRICEKTGCRADTLKFQSLCATVELAGKRVLLLKPTTYMNLSGQAVQEAMQFYKIPPQRAIILFDDISLEVGRIRVRRKGSDGGHNGIKNIIYLTGQDCFPRVKIGVGKKPHPDYNLADWVLSRFTQAELQALSPALDHTAEAVEEMIAGRIDQAMNRFNSANA